MRDAQDSAPPAKARPGILRNVLINAIGMGVAHGFSALSGLLTARALGPPGVGVLAVSFGLVEFGRSLSNFTHSPSIIAYHRGGDPERVFGSSLTMKLIGSMLFVALVGALSPWLASVFSIPWWAVVLASGVLVMGAFYEVGTAKMEADNRMMRRNLLLASGPLIGFGIIATLYLTGRLTVLTSILTTVTSVAIMSASFFADEPRLFRFRLDPKLSKWLFTYGFRIVAASILAQGLLWTDTFMVSILLGNAATGVYSVVFQLTYVMVTASIAVGVSLMPAFSELAGRGEDTSVGFQRGTLIAFGMSVLLSLVLLVAGPFILRLYGPEFVGGYPTLLILLVFGISAATAVPASSLLTVHGHAGWITIISFAQLLVNVPLNYVLITRFGILGAAVATASVFTTGTLLQWFLVRRTTGAVPLTRGVVTEAFIQARRWVEGILT